MNSVCKSAPSQDKSSQLLHARQKQIPLWQVQENELVCHTSKGRRIQQRPAMIGVQCLKVLAAPGFQMRGAPIVSLLVSVQHQPKGLPQKSHSSLPPHYKPFHAKQNIFVKANTCAQGVYLEPLVKNSTDGRGHLVILWMNKSCWQVVCRSLHRLALIPAANQALSTVALKRFLLNTCIC